MNWFIKLLDKIFQKNKVNYLSGKGKND